MYVVKCIQRTPLFTFACGLLIGCITFVPFAWIFAAKNGQLFLDAAQSFSQAKTKPHF